MKLFLVVLMALALASCVTTKPEPIELCISSPQQTNNELQCQDIIQNKKHPNFLLILATATDT